MAVYLCHEQPEHLRDISGLEEFPVPRPERDEARRRWTRGPRG